MGCDSEIVGFSCGIDVGNGKFIKSPNGLTKHELSNGGIAGNGLENAPNGTVSNGTNTGCVINDEFIVPNEVMFEMFGNRFR